MPCGFQYGAHISAFEGANNHAHPTVVFLLDTFPPVLAAVPIEYPRIDAKNDPLNRVCLPEFDQRDVIFQTGPGHAKVDQSTHRCASIELIGARGSDDQMVDW